MLLMAALLAYAGGGLLQVSADDLQAPSISLTPAHPVYITGESLQITCSAPEGARASAFLYFKNGTLILQVSRMNKNSYSHTLSSVNASSAGSYYCVYTIINMRIEEISSESRRVILKVTDRPPAPSISLTPPHSVYVRGESVTVICSAPAGYTPRGFRYFKKAEGNFTEVTSQGNDTQEISTADPEAAGSYSCAYRIQTSGREIQSRRSGEQSISVTDPLLSPTLSLDLPDVRVKHGANLTLTCSASNGYGKLTFYFLSEEEMIGSKSPDLGEDSTWISLPGTPENYSQNRAYSCYYEVEIGGRTLRSNISYLTANPEFPETAPTTYWVRPLCIAGAFTLVNTLIFLGFRYS